MRWLRWCAWSVVATLLLGALWIGGAQIERLARERKSVEEIAAGRGRWIDAGDARLFVQEWGEVGQPTLLLTHGTGAWSGTWFGLPAALAKSGWRVVAMDLPPFGLSQTPESAAGTDYSRTAQARRVLKIVDALGGSVVLVGHSFGAGPALEAAMHGGPRVRQLVLVDPALGLSADGSAPACEGGTASAPWVLQHRSVRTALVGATATWPLATGTLLKRFVHRKAVVTEELLPAYRQPFARTEFSAALSDWALAFSGVGCESAESLSPAKLRAWAARDGLPIHLIWGEQDGVTPLPQAQALQAWMPDTRLTVLPGVGHIPHIEDPEHFEQALLAALRR